MDVNVRMGASVMRHYLKELKVDGSWLSQKPRQTLLTGDHQASGLPASLARSPGLATPGKCSVVGDCISDGMPVCLTQGAPWSPSACSWRPSIWTCARAAGAPPPASCCAARPPPPSPSPLLWPSEPY